MLYVVYSENLYFIQVMLSVEGRISGRRSTQKNIRLLSVVYRLPLNIVKRLLFIVIVNVDLTKSLFKLCRNTY